MDDTRDQFPIGMRVLAVDDDPICLKLLERLLTSCQYDVTVTKNAISALKLLRENKNKFDLVISDVVMPNMDGLKLLELVELEMDLPVIMLSGNDDPKMVMKGITRGACDYLLKPIRIEELKNIWQHVIRKKKKKIDSKEQNKTNNQDIPDSGLGNAVESATTGDSDQNEKQTRKRKDHDEDEYDDGDEYESNGDDNEDPSNEKKARVVWSVELHRKFVSAVNQLGIDKAVPKKILDLMNVEKLTRENVASHLQKYRLYLKRISCVANKQANMVAALGSADSSYLRTGSLNGVGGFQTLSGYGQFPHNNAAFKSFPTSGMIGRLNTPSSLFGTHQLGQNLNNSANDQHKFQSAIGCDYLNGVHGIPASVSLVQNLTNVDDTKIPFPILNNKLADQMPKVTMGSASTPIFGISNNALMLESNPQDTQENSEFPFSLVNNSSCNDIWSSAVHSFRTSSFPPSQCFRQTPAVNLTSLSNQCPDSFTDMHSQNNDVSFQWWDDANVIGSSINSPTPVNGVVDPQGHNSTNSTFGRNSDFNFSNPLQMKHDRVSELTGDYSLKPHQVYTMNHIAGSLGHYNDE
ncbi:hypothetical protein TanjilG_07248 [Lupinus angustifolius]|uniref:Two-component response regulator n=1 Tax=Lupinus angustifolius TaxID=3871 RepID=A0A1J7GRD0_LUPAN|nr:PREDICTED: two-component response regulator ARR12-like [Lupinus angustifolius]OIW03096.1 hypothetical protein TanjilG_07248 [Lupinus angustifolius]